MNSDSSLGINIALRKTLLIWKIIKFLMYGNTVCRDQITGLLKKKFLSGKWFWCVWHSHMFLLNLLICFSGLIPCHEKEEFNCHSILESTFRISFRFMFCQFAMHSHYELESPQISTICRKLNTYLNTFCMLLTLFIIQIKITITIFYY